MLRRAKINTIWNLPVAPVNLPESDVHIWLASLHYTQERVSKAQRLLSPDELASARRFVFERDRKRYIVSHSILRTLIGQYLDIHPSHVTFAHNEHGKPYLGRNHNALNVSFNMSYSRELALYAFARENCQIGIDIEYLQSDIDCKSIAQSLFSTDECKLISNLTGADLYEAFFTIWVRKEAYVKAHGEGLSLRLDEFDVSRHIVSKNPVESPIISVIDGNNSTWRIKDVVIAHNFVAAFAMQGQILEAKHWLYSVKQE